MIKNVQVIA